MSNTLTTESPPAAASSTAEAASEHLTVIAPHPGWRALNLHELWRHRELLYFLAWRDVKIRYTQTLLGAFWAILQPLLYSIVFLVVFSRVAHVPSDAVPYLLFAFSGLVLWMFFSTAVTQSGNSVVGSEALITKVYFPRLAIPFAAVGAALFDFVVTFVVLVLMILAYTLFTDKAPTVTASWTLLLVPGLVFLTFVAALAIGTFLAALNVSYRDFKHTIPFLVQLWMFATPAIYLGTDHDAPPELQYLLPPSHTAAADAKRPSSAVESPAEKVASATSEGEAASAPSGETKKPVAVESEGAVPGWIHFALKFNPMTGLVRSFRSALLGQPMPWNHLAYSTVIVLVSFVGACFYFHRVEDSFADII